MPAKKMRTKQREPSLFLYRHGTTLIHKIPAGLKLLLLALICMRLFSENSDLVAKNFTHFAKAVKIDLANIGLWKNSCYFADFMSKNIQIFCLFFYALVIFASWALAKIPFARLKKLRFVLFICLFVVCLRAVSISPKLHFDMAGAKSGLLYSIRFFFASALSLVVFETTSRLQIQSVFENTEKILLKIFPPLKKVPLALSISLAISFLPEIFSVWEQVNLAAAARNPCGANKFRVFGVKIWALFSCMLGRAEERRRAVASRLPCDCQSF